MQTAPATALPVDHARHGWASAQPPRVFISYSQESVEHADRVLELADRLRRDGVDAMIDQYVASPPEGWPLWMDRQIDESDFVLLVCTETYYRRVMGREEPGKGLGVRWEGMLVYQHIFDAAAANARFIPVLFDPSATEYIPRPVKGASRYCVDAEGGYEALCRRLMAQPETLPPPVSPQLRQWRRDPDQAIEFKDIRRLGEVVVQAAGDGRALVHGEPHLTLSRRHGRRRPLRSDLDLLNPFSRAIPLIGREAEMAGLQAWLASPAPIAARCIIGRAGSGKTRLAIELCEWAEAREWRAGFVDPGELVRFHRQQNLSDWGWQRPTLAVVDGAAVAARVLRQWLVELADNPGDPDRPFRLLLLERHADRKLGWWFDLVTPRSFQEDGLADLFAPTEPCLLPSISSHADRLRLAAAGAAAAMSRKGVDAQANALASDPVAGSSQGPAEVSAGVEPLYLLMQAVTAAGNAPATAKGRTALARHLARFELGRIEMLAEDRQLKGDFLSHMAGFVTLAGGLPLDRLTDAIAGEQAALHWQGAGDPPELAEALQDALAAIDGDRGGVVPAVLPELIGEAVVLAALEKQPPEAQAAIVRRGWAAGGRSCIAAVVRTAQDFADGKDHASLRWLDALAQAAEKPAELMAISDQLPERTTCMIERAAEIDRRLVEAHRPLAADGGAGSQLTLAQCLTRLACRSRDVCRLEDALAAAEEAVAVQRELRRSEAPASSAAGLAEALLGLGGAACDLGRREEALAASSEAVDLLQGETHASARRSRAHALSIMACHLSDIGRREEALSAADEAVRLHRELAAAQPETETPPLALALLNLAHCRNDLDRVADALAAAEEGVGYLAGFARTKPDAFLSAYAQALNSAAVCLAQMGSVADALGRSREAIAIQRSLTDGCPEAYRPDLALMLNGYANALRRSGDAVAALATLDEAVALLRALAKERPEAYRPQLAKQLSNKSILLIASADTAGALGAAAEAVTLLREAAAKRPDRHDEDLASALACLAFCHREAGHPQDMLDSATQSVAIRRRLAARWPEAFRQPLARSLLVLTEALKLCGRSVEAEKTAAEAVALLEA